MKGVVFETNDKNTIVLTETGEFKKLKINDETLEVGSEIEIPVSRNTKYFSAIAAVFIFFMFSITTYMVYYTPFGYAFVDINPSIKMVFNRFDKVIDVIPLNEDGQKVVDNIGDIKYKEIDDAMGEIVAEAEEQNYLKKDKENHILITVTISGKKGEAKKEVLEEVNNIAEEIDIPVNISLLEVDISKYEDESQISLGRKELEKNLKLEGEEVKKYSVKDLVERNSNNRDLTIESFKNKKYNEYKKPNENKDVVKQENKQNKGQQKIEEKEEMTIKIGNEAVDIIKGKEEKNNYENKNGKNGKKIVNKTKNDENKEIPKLKTEKQPIVEENKDIKNGRIIFENRNSTKEKNKGKIKTNEKIKGVKQNVEEKN